MEKEASLLLVEDDPVTCEVLCLMLADDGWQVTSAPSGEAALEHLRNARLMPRLLLCDQNLPGLRGSALAESIRNVYRDADQVPPVLLAMSASRGTVPDGYAALLLKPFSVEQVRLAFEECTCQLRTESKVDLSETSAPEERTALPVLDRAIVHTLQTSMGNERLRELFAFALADATDRVRRMHAAIVSNDSSALAREAHMLKGAAGMIGARRLAMLAHDLETWPLDHSETGGHSASKMAMLTAALDDIERMLEMQFPAQA